VKDLRQNYTQGELTENQISDNPFTQFQHWFTDALNSEIIEPNAMVLSSVDNEKPDSRIVLLKDVRDNEFVFYTNYESHKGQQLQKNPHCSLLFPWVNLERQVIVRGQVSKISHEESEEYFLSRPRSSQIGAWASNQSKPIDSRKDLEKQLSEIEKKFESEPLTKPPYWGGFAVNPQEIEFWQGRPNRLHDRIRYTLEGDAWIISRLQP
jgi:pyridoxamine 5'-phosphate oxidase